MRWADVRAPPRNSPSGWPVRSASAPPGLRGPAARRAVGDEPGRGAPSRGRHRRAPARQRWTGTNRAGRPRRQAPVPGVRRGCREGAGGGGVSGAVGARTVADADDRVRRAAPGRSGRPAGHGVAQPAAGQRPEGLSAGRCADRRADRCGHRGGDRGSGTRGFGGHRRQHRCPGRTIWFRRIWRARPRRLVGQRGKLRIAATPMHGVGGESLVHALALAGFTDVHIVGAQAAPDADFPTVAFPNPEEPGATDLLLALAAEVNADLAIANDPDADRCALGIPTGDGGWRMLRGDETGVLLGDHVLRTLDRAAHPDPLVATTIVSSSMLRTIAAAHGARYDETLTGFKWIVRAGDGAGTGLVFGYEEALGVCVDPDAVRDKDGISAAVLAADLAATPRRAGRDARGPARRAGQDARPVLPPTSCRCGWMISPRSRRRCDSSVRTFRRNCSAIRCPAPRICCRAPTRSSCAPDGPGWWCGPPARSPSSSATWKSSRRSRRRCRPQCGPRTGRRGDLGALRTEIAAALGISAPLEPEKLPPVD